MPHIASLGRFFQNILVVRGIYANITFFHRSHTGATLPVSMDGLRVAANASNSLETKEASQTSLKQEISQRVEEIVLTDENKTPTHTNSVRNEPKEQNGVKYEGNNIKQDVKSAESDEDLKKYNRKIPADRSSFKKDEIDAHFDR